MTIETHKTVFISYRRNVSSFIARAIYQDLLANGFTKDDIFFDVQSIDSGEFDTIILRQIVARGHFLIVCTSGTFDRCNEPGDWLRREIEHALDNGRNVVPIFVNEFKFDDATKKHLTGKLVELPRRHGLNVPHDFFEEAMTQLRTRYLKQPVIGEIVAPPKADKSVVEAKQAEAISKTGVSYNYLKSLQYFLDAIMREETDYAGKIADYSVAIRLNSQAADLYVNRGDARRKKGDIDGAIADYNEAIRLNPENSDTYNIRAITQLEIGDLDDAIADASKAIELNPNDFVSYGIRGEAYAKKDEYVNAIADYEIFLILDGGKKSDNVEEVESKIRDLKHKLEKQQKP